jgi:hypothetical protein
LLASGSLVVVRFKKTPEIYSRRVQKSLMNAIGAYLIRNFFLLLFPGKVIVFKRCDVRGNVFDFSMWVIGLEHISKYVTPENLNTKV